MTSKGKARKDRASARGHKRKTRGALGGALILIALIFGLSLLSASKNTYVFKDRHGIDLFLGLFFYIQGSMGHKIFGVIGWSVLPLLIGLLWTGIQLTGWFSLRPTMKGISGFLLSFFCIMLTGAVFDRQGIPGSISLGGDIGRIVGSNLIYSLGWPVFVCIVAGAWGLLSVVIFGMWPARIISLVTHRSKSPALKQERHEYEVQTDDGKEQPADKIEEAASDPQEEEGAEPAEDQAKDRATQTAAECRKRLDNEPPYRQPPLELLAAVEPKDPKDNRLEETAREIESKLAEMDIGVAVHETHPGPVITRYDVELKKGQRLKTVLGAQQDLSLTLGAPVRILSIARKGLVGIEVPNAKRSDIRLRSLIEDALRDTSRDKEEVRVPIGLTPVGEPFDMDLCRAPHLLVAGTTGSGKSVFLNALVTGIAYGHSTDAVRLVLVDPKMVEFSFYNGLPHLLHPVVTDAAVCDDLLSYLVQEMDRRYRLLAESGCRDIRTFRHKMAASGNTGMPYIVVIIDEFADLFLAKTSDLETLIVRLAQKARAIGIHLVMATQRPSTDVVKGLIKANFPSRLAFKVGTGVDSRVILDEEGAESLLGNGDMLLKSPECSGLQRLHGPYVSQEEIEAFMKFFKP